MSSIGAQIGSATGPDGERADVELRLPADSAYASVLRTTTAGLAARLDFPIDDIEDLRIAVGEASAMVLPEARPGSDLTCRFYLRPGELTVRIGVGGGGGGGGRPPPPARGGGGAPPPPPPGPPRPAGFLRRPGAAPGGLGGVGPPGGPPRRGQLRLAGADHTRDRRRHPDRGRRLRDLGDDGIGDP